LEQLMIAFDCGFNRSMDDFSGTHSELYDAYLKK
jgi:hypothetical protein